jgi:uncharacterized membrane protein
MNGPIVSAGGWLPNALLALHLLAAAAWVGGMLYALVVLRPALTVLDPAQRLQMHMLTLKRFFLVVWHAMPIMLLTGWGMIVAVGWDMGHLPWYVNAMQGLGLVMAAVFLFTFFGPFRRLRRAIRPGPEFLDRIRQMVTLNLVLGAVIIVIAALGHAW